MTFQLRSDQLQTIQAHAERTYPDECCGLLLGQREADSKILIEIRSLENAWTPDVAAELATPTLTKSRRYWIAPEAMLAAMRDARTRDLNIIGIYHSHPDHPAVPSECDRQLAWQQYSYLIVSVEQGHAKRCQSWVLDDDDRFQSELLLVQEPQPKPAN